MNIVLEYLILSAGVAYFLYEMWFRDAYKARLQPIWTTGAEQNWIFQGKDGKYSPTKGAVISGIVFAIGVTVAVLVSPWVMGLIFGASGGGLRWATSKDWKNFKTAIEWQKGVLTLLKKDPDGDHVPLPTVQAGKWTCGTFYDFTEPSDLLPQDPNYPAKQLAALAKIKPRLVVLSKKRESDWFKLDRSEGI